MDYRSNFRLSLFLGQIELSVRYPSEYVICGSEMNFLIFFGCRWRSDQKKRQDDIGSKTTQRFHLSLLEKKNQGKSHLLEQFNGEIN